MEGRVAPNGLVTVQTQQEEAPPRRPWNVAWLIVGMAVGAMIGIIATWTLLSGELANFAAWLDAVLDLLLAAAGGFGLAVVLGVPLSYWLLRRFVGTAQGTLAQVIDDATAAAEAATERNAAAAVSHAGRALREAAAWYAPVATRRFVVQTTLGLLVTFGGLVGTGLLFRQTLLLTDQNRKIDKQLELLTQQNSKLDLQTVTAEAQRRGALSAELFSIMQAVTAGDDVPNLAAADATKAELRQLSRGLTARIVAFSRAAEPYWIAEVSDLVDGKVPLPRLADRPGSPERGQLLIGLLVAGVDIAALNKKGAVFFHANLRGIDLSSANLRNVNLAQTDLRDALLIGADLRGAHLFGASLERAVLFAANMEEAALEDADLERADLERANLKNTNLKGANLRGAKVGAFQTVGQLPERFPEGWSTPPEGWRLYYAPDGRVYLQQQ